MYPTLRTLAAALRALAVPAAVAASLMPATAGAAIVSFTSSAAFQAAVPGLQVQTYEAPPPGTVVASGSAIDGAVYTFNNGRAGRIDAFYNALGVQSLAAAPTAAQPADFFLPGDTITVSFAGPVDAVGIFVNSNLVEAGDYFLATESGTAFNGAAYDVETFYFIGLLSDVPFTSVTIGQVPTGASGFNVDNLSFRLFAPGGTPEPASLALAAVALAGLWVARARRT